VHLVIALQCFDHELAQITSNSSCHEHSHIQQLRRLVTALRGTKKIFLQYSIRLGNMHLQRAGLVARILSTFLDGNREHVY
jgi:hypothetical protein